MNSFVLLVGFFVGAEPVLSPKSAAEPVAAAPRRFHEIERDIHNALRNEAQAKSRDQRTASILRLVELHREIVGDSRFAQSDVLKEYRGKIAVRLIDVKTKLKRSLANKPKTNTLETGSLSQVIGEQASLANQVLAGPVQLVGSATGLGGAAWDDGQTLVELIQATINPKFWDVNGGPGTIVYFAPLRCLVVRATAEAHHEAGGLVGALRDVGR